MDFNHPLAGKTIEYRVKILKKLTKDDEKLIALIHRRLPRIDKSRFKVEISEGIATIKLPQEAILAEGIQIVKRALASDVRKYLPKIKLLRFVEEFRIAEEKPAKEESAGTKESPPQQQ